MAESIISERKYLPRDENFLYELLTDIVFSLEYVLDTIEEIADMKSHYMSIRWQILKERWKLKIKSLYDFFDKYREVLDSIHNIEDKVRFYEILRHFFVKLSKKFISTKVKSFIKKEKIMWVSITIREFENIMKDMNGLEDHITQEFDYTSEELRKLFQNTYRKINSLYPS